MPTYKVLCLEDYSLVEYKAYRSTVTKKVCRLHFRAISRISQSWKQILRKAGKFLVTQLHQMIGKVISYYISINEY